MKFPKLPEPVIFWCLLSGLTSNTSYSVCSPLLPIEFERLGIESSWIGVTFSVYALGMIIVSPIVGKYMDIFSARNIMGLGLAVMGFAFIGFGFIHDMENKMTIILISCTLRFIHGIGCNM